MLMFFRDFRLISVLSCHVTGGRILADNIRPIPSVSIRGLRGRPSTAQRCGISPNHLGKVSTDLARLAVRTGGSIAVKLLFRDPRLRCVNIDGVCRGF